MNSACLFHWVLVYSLFSLLMMVCNMGVTPYPTLIAMVSQPAAVASPLVEGAVERPEFNMGRGFFVADGILYDANGVEFRIRGVNKAHYEVESPGLPNSHANTVRLVTPLWLPPEEIAPLIQDLIDNAIVPMPGVWYTDYTWDEEGNVVCKEDVSSLRRVVDLWLDQAQTLKPFERYMLVNIASEWGPGDTPEWRDAYIKAVNDLRNAGYLNTLVIDTGGCGQDPSNILHYGQEVLENDPEHNLVFSVHVYGFWSNGAGESWQTDLSTAFDELQDTGLPILIGEFGPGRDIGPSPTMITPGEVILASEARGFGWLAWAWDDPPYEANNDWFALSINGDYEDSPDLTEFGKDVVENLDYGLLQLSLPASLFYKEP